MKQTRFILLFFAIASMSQFNFCAQQLANQLTQESYISPAMQWAIVSCFKKPDTVAIDTTTGALQGMQNVQEILQAINQKTNQPASQSMQQALHTMLEATDIAIITASIKIAYKDPAFLPFAQELPQVLEQQKQAIAATLSTLQAQPSSDNAAPTNSYFSWWNNKKQPALSTEIGRVDATNPNLVIIPVSLMESIIQLNDYKTKSNSVQAANLLFQQCFIAQQQHKNNRIALNLVQPISANNYIFTNFPKIYDSATKTYPVCDQIIQAQGKGSLQTLLHIRQAIQTALYIANKNSIINVGYILPTSITSYLDGIVSQLTQYDNQLGKLCTNPTYGGTANIAQSEQWSTVTKLALGAVGVAAVTGAILAYDPQALNKASDFVTNQASQAMNWFKGDSLQKDTNSLINKLAQDEEIARLEKQAADKAESDRIAEQARLEAVRIAKENERARLAEIARLEKQADDLQARNDLFRNIKIGVGIGGGLIAVDLLQALSKNTNQLKEISRTTNHENGTIDILYENPDKTQSLKQFDLETGILKKLTKYDLLQQKTEEIIFNYDKTIIIKLYDPLTQKIIQIISGEINEKGSLINSIIYTVQEIAQAYIDLDLQPYVDDLGIHLNQNVPNISAAYKKMALKVHPDKGGDPEQFKAVKNASELLQNYLEHSDEKFSGKEFNDAVNQKYKTLSSQSKPITAELAMKKSFSSNDQIVEQQAPAKKPEKQNTDLQPQPYSEQILESVYHEIKKVSSPDIISAGPIKTVDDYISRWTSEKARYNLSKNILEPYQYVIDVRGDGNCAYRAFIISACINNHDHISNCFRNLINFNFVQLFMSYDQIFKKSHNKQEIGKEIKLFLLQTLATIESAPDIQTILKIFNENIVFDYYMIMFCRYMLADHITNKITDQQKDEIVMTVNLKREDDHKEALSPHDAILSECEKVLTWGEWIDQLEIVQLSFATEINIHPVQLDAAFNSNTNLTNYLGDAYILFIDRNHYQVLVKKTTSDPVHIKSNDGSKTKTADIQDID